jgi:phenylpropionate dioxygenase-like ring-hydroxylating dioxygenase large terminal subunit
MLSKAENELLTHVGPETPGGALLRRYWHPVLKAAELEAGGAPKAVRLLGESFVAFRSPDGTVGFIDEFCPHRCASLALGRNEPGGLRCIFHGWKFDVHGSVVEVPSEPAARAESFAGKVRTRRYLAREVAGLIWAFIGAGEPAPFPAFPFTSLPVDHIDVAQVPGKCNWVQLLEGQIDSAHLSHLHSSSVTGRISDLALADRAPEFDVQNTPWGFHVAAIRTMRDGRRYTRLTEFVMPYYEFIPPAAAPDAPFYADAPRFVVCQVPNDDHHTTVWYIMWTAQRPIQRGEIGAMWEVWNQEWQTIADKPMWEQNRAQMADGHYTGINNLLSEDMAVAESMGPLADRSREYLGSSDTAVARFRRVYFDAIRANADGLLPRGCSPDTPFRLIEGRGIYHQEDGWQRVLDPALVTVS